MLGLPVGTIGDSFEKYFSYVHPDDLPLVQETLSEAIRKRENDKTVEYRLRKADGATLWVQSKFSVHGRFSVYGTARDITQQRQAEVALLESAKKYRQLVDTANESIIVAQDGLLKFVNPMTLGLLGVDSEQELIDRPFPEFIHPDDRSMLVENHRRRIANEAFPPRYAFRVVARDGIVKWVEINAALIEWQGKPATLNFLTDITEHKLAEVALQESEERFHTIFENSSAAMAIIERDTTISMVNKEYCKLGLFEKKDVIGISWTSQIPPEDLGRLLEYNRKRLIDPKSAPSKYEFKFYRKDGKILNCLMSVGVIPTTQQIICSFTDITSGRERIPYLLTCILYQRKGFHLDPVSFILSAFALDRMVAAILQHRCLYFLPGNYFQRARTSCCINLYLPRQNVPFYHQLGELPCHSAPGRQPSR